MATLHEKLFSSLHSFELASSLGLKGFLIFISEMALSIVKGLLDQYIQSLVDEGILSYQFSQIHTSKTLERPDCVEQLINTYCNDVEAILLELTSNIDRPDVDFTQMAALARQVGERSAR
ncbi:hypothetical protein JRO89_XS10G0191900 [Xanthoceras sorbifolium]|uniref:Histidine-containing phosphotransfer protein n=1 Tax=Xanthoceras sorbifolium TaxID=99658 RepID=A0ABQ8HJF8_9ROSI|nr:hypothetical protein JRO89_XS10G0191900 [Xanthoceras sorbifolium]